MADEALLTDLALVLIRHDALSIYRARDEEKRSVVGRRSVKARDFVPLSGRDNLRQAVMMRLFTPQGELAALGHPEYGSRLPSLIGEQRTETTRNLAKLYVIEALKQERRIAKIVASGRARRSEEPPRDHDRNSSATDRLDGRRRCRPVHDKHSLGAPA